MQKDPEVIMSHLIMNMYKKKESHIQVNPARSEGFPIHLPGGLECTNPTNPDVKHNTGCNQDTPVLVDKNSSSELHHIVFLNNPLLFLINAL